MSRKKSSRPPPRDPSDNDISSPFLPDKRSFRNDDTYNEYNRSSRHRDRRSNGSSRRDDTRSKKKRRDPIELDESVNSEEYDDFIGQNTSQTKGSISTFDEEEGYLDRRSEKIDRAVMTSEDDRNRNQRKEHPELLRDKESKKYSTRTEDRYEERQPYKSSSKPSKRSKNKWYKNASQDSNNQRRFDSSDYNASGVKYRSPSSTLRALEEIKRKKLEARERKRAAGILAMLLIVAVGVHLMGRDTSGLISTGVVAKQSIGDSAAVDKVYGKLKSGGTRSSAVDKQGAGSAVAAPMQGGSPNNAAILPSGSVIANPSTAEDYPIPPPKEKTYDDAHQFLAPLHHFSDVRDTPRPTDTAFFFHVPRAGGSTIKAMLGKCMRLVQASEVGVRDGHDQDTALQVLTVQENKYVNVDTTTIPGIQRAVDMGLTRSGMSDLIVSSYFHESAALFDLEHQGRAFIMLRNPIERAVSMYYHRLHELHDIDESVSIEDYAQGNGIENNWMTRFLANRMTGELTKEDLEQAKEILKEKFLIGFLDDLEESIYRIILYNGWKYAADETEKMKQEDCITDLTKVGSNINAEGYEIPKRGTQAYALIIWQTQFDSKLYDYAKLLFDDQTKSYGTKERKKQRKKEKQKKKGG